MAQPTKIKTTNKVLFDTIRSLKKVSKEGGVEVFEAVAELLNAPASRRPEVNLAKIERLATEGEKVIIPGKVLATGELTKKVTIIAFKASEEAIRKIKASGSTFVELRDFIAKKPDVQVRILI